MKTIADICDGFVTALTKRDAAAIRTTEFIFPIEAKDAFLVHDLVGKAFTSRDGVRFEVLEVKPFVVDRDKAKVMPLKPPPPGVQAVMDAGAIFVAVRLAREDAP